MNDILQQSQAESKILSYKLDKIRKHINQRILIVDPIVKNELKVILNLIASYEKVPYDWKLENPLVEIPDKEEKINV